MGALYSSTYGTTPENEAIPPTPLHSTDGLHSPEEGNPKTPPHKEDVELSKQNHCSESSVDSGFASVSSASVTDFDEEEDEGEELQTGHLFKDAFDILQSDAGFLGSSPSGTLINENYILRAPVEELLLNTTPIENKQHAASIEELYSFPMPFPTNQGSGWKVGGKLQPSDDGGDGICSVIEEEEEEDEANKVAIADAGDSEQYRESEQYDFHQEDELYAEEGIEEVPGENSLVYHYTHEIHHESIKVTYSDGVVRETLEQISIEENCDTDSEYSDLDSDDHIEDGDEDYEYEEDQNLLEYEENQNLSEYEEDQNHPDDASDEYSDSDAEERLTNSSLTSVTDLLDSFENEEDSGFLIPAQTSLSEHEESMQPLNRESVSEHMDEDRGLRIEDFEICRDDADVQTDVSLIKKGEYNTWIHFSPHHSEEEGEDMEDYLRNNSSCQADDITDHNRSDSIYDPYQADYDDNVDLTDPEEDLIFDDPKPDFQDWIQVEWNNDHMVSMCEEHGCLHEDDTNSSEEGTGSQNLTEISSLQGVIDIEDDSFTTRNDLINEGDIEDVNPHVQLSVEGDKKQHDLLVIDSDDLEHGSIVVTDDHGEGLSKEENLHNSSMDDYYRLCYGPDVQVESQQDNSSILPLGINSTNEDSEFLKHNSGINVMEEVFHDMVIHVDDEFQDEDCSANQGDDELISNEHEKDDLAIDSYSSVDEQIISYHNDHSISEGAFEKDGVIHEECTYVDKTIHDESHSTKEKDVNVIDFEYMTRSTECKSSSDMPKEEDEYGTSSVIEISAAILDDGAGETPNQEYINQPFVEDDHTLDLGIQKLESIEEVEGSPGPIDHAFDDATSQVNHEIDDLTSQTDCDELNGQRDHEFDELTSQRDHEFDKLISQKDHEFDESISQSDHEFDESVSQRDHEFDESISQNDHEFDESISQRDHEFDESVSQRDHEFDESVSQRDHEFDESVSQRDHEFAESSSQKDHEFDELISQKGHEFDESISQNDHEFDKSIAQRDHESISQNHQFDESISQKNHAFDESISQRDHKFDESTSQIDLDIGYSTCQVDLGLGYSTSRISQTNHGFDDSTSQVHLKIDNPTSEIALGFDDSSIHTSQEDDYSTSQMDHGFEDSTSLELDDVTSQTGQTDLKFDYSISQIDYEFDYPTSQMDNESDYPTSQMIHEYDGLTSQMDHEYDDVTSQTVHELDGASTQIGSELVDSTSQIDRELYDSTSQIDHGLADTTTCLDHDLHSSSPEDHELHNLTTQTKNELKDSTHIHHELHDSASLIDSGLDTTYYSEDEDDCTLSWGSGQWGRSTYNTAITNLTVSDLSYKDISQIATMLHEGCTYNYWYTVGTGLLHMYGQHIAITKYELEDLYRLHNGDRTKAMNFLEAMKSCEPKYKLLDFRLVAIRLKRMDVYLSMEGWDEQLLSNLPHEKQIHLANLLDQKNSGSGWQDFARLIGFSRNEIKHMHEFVTAPHMELMLRLRSKGGNLRLGCLCAIFDDLSRPDIIELIERLIRRNDRIR